MHTFALLFALVYVVSIGLPLRYALACVYSLASGLFASDGVLRMICSCGRRLLVRSPERAGATTALAAVAPYLSLRHYPTHLIVQTLSLRYALGAFVCLAPGFFALHGVYEFACLVDGVLLARRPECADVHHRVCCGCGCGVVASLIFGHRYDVGLWRLCPYAIDPVLGNDDCIDQAAVYYTPEVLKSKG